MKETIVIIGSHPRTRKEFDFKRTDCDIWLFNEALSNKTFTRADAVFQMHEEAIWRNPANRNDPQHYEWLTTQNEITIYMQECYPEVPKSLRFPLDEIVDRFKIKYFTSSVTYAMALACFMGYKRIELYGVEMETNTEYQYQRDGVTLWLGVALGLGIDVDAHISMFDQPLYGYEGEAVIPYERFGERISELMPQIEQATKEHAAMLINLQQAVRAFVNESSRDAENHLHAMVDKQLGIGGRLGLLDGAKQENEKYRGKADKMRAASEGEFLFSRQEFESSAKNLSDKAKHAHTEFVSLGTTLGHIHQNIMSAAKGSPKRAKLMQAYTQHVQVYLQANNRMSIYKGAAEENFRYMAWLDKHIRAAGGAKSEAVILGRLQVQNA